MMPIVTPGSAAIEVTLVGTSGGIAADQASLQRRGPAVIVDLPGALLLVDAGRNVLQGLHGSGIDPAEISHLAFTHYHCDHTVGLPDLILSTWVGSGMHRWTVLGPVGAGQMLDRLFGVEGAFRPDIEARAFSPTSRKLFMERMGRPLEAPAFDVQEITQDGTVINGEGWRLDASFAPDHVQPALVSIAYRVVTPTGTVVITGDTGPNDAITEFARGADLLIHDCTLLERHGVYTSQQVHTDAVSLGRLAATANVKAVVGTHITRTIDHPEVLAQFPARVAEHYDGQFYMGSDGLRITIDELGIRFHTRTQGD